MLQADTMIWARHPHWNLHVSLDFYNNRLRFSHDNTYLASFVLSAPFLIVRWDEHQPEVFKFVDDCLVHSSMTDEDKIDFQAYQVGIARSGAKVLLRRFGSDIASFHQVFTNLDYDIGSLPNQAKTIVDLGANIGLASVYLALRFPEAQIVSVEPGRKNFELLCENTLQFNGRVHSLLGAIWHSDVGELEVGELDENGNDIDGWAIRTKAISGADCMQAKHTVEAFSMQRLMLQYELPRVDILKVDIEGAERELFSQNTDWLDQVDCVVAESHERMCEGSHDAVMSICDKGFKHVETKGENLVFLRS